MVGGGTCLICLGWGNSTDKQQGMMMIISADDKKFRKLWKRETFLTLESTGLWVVKPPHEHMKPDQQGKYCRVFFQCRSCGIVKLYRSVRLINPQGRR